MKKRNKLLLIAILILAAVLRFYALNTVPYGLYIDEVSIAHNAHTILVSGKDEHGEFLPVFFKAFGEYKLPVYIYLTTGAMELFGRNDFAVRFPSAFFGTATVGVIYFFVIALFTLNLFKDSEKRASPTTIALLSAFLVAVSPWHIHFSRGGFEANVALFFYILGSTLALIFWQKRMIKLLFFSCLSLIIAFYTYNTYRFLVPLTIIFFLTFVFFKLPKIRNYVITALLAVIIFSIPMVMFSLSQNGAARFAETSAFSEYKAEKFVDKAYLYPVIFVKDYLSYFSFEFLFSYGDRNGRHQLPGWGLFYRWELPFLLLGFLALIKLRKKTVMWFLLSLLFLVPIIPAIARPSPHSLRALLMVVPLVILIALGIVTTYQYLTKFRYGFVFILLLVLSYEGSLYLHQYHAHYNNVNALDWGAGYKEMVLKAQSYQHEYDYIVVEQKLSNTELYAKFYAPSLQAIYAGDNWKMPDAWKGKKVLLIRPYYGNRYEKLSIDQVYLPGPNQDIFAQFWKL